MHLMFTMDTTVVRSLGPQDRQYPGQTSALDSRLVFLYVWPYGLTSKGLAKQIGPVG